jgi:hypothetical protein
MSFVGPRNEFAKWLAEWMAHLKETGHSATSVPSGDVLTFTNENAEAQLKPSHMPPYGGEGKPQAKHRKHDC